MKEFRCSFGQHDFMPIAAMNADDAALEYANRYSSDIRNKSEVKRFLHNNKGGICRIHVLNDSDRKDEGWFRVQYHAVIIAETSPCETPHWAQSDENQA